MRDGIIKDWFVGSFRPRRAMALPGAIKYQPSTDTHLCLPILLPAL